MLRSDPKAAWQGDESCVLMYPVYLRADRSMQIRVAVSSLARAASPRPASHSPQVSWTNTTPVSGRAYGRFGLDNAFLGWVWRSVLVSSRVLSENSARAEGTELAAKNTRSMLRKEKIS